MSDPPADIVTDAFATSAGQQRAAHGFVSHARLIGAITFVSRLLGMARESIAAAYFGSGAIYSAFQFAFTIPNLFRKLLGEGALSAAFIPLYAQAVRRDARDDANAFASSSVNLLCAILLGLTLVGELLLGALVWLVPMPWDYLLAARLTMLMLPYVLLICGTAFLGSILQVHGRFAVVTLTAVVSNLCLIVAMVLAAEVLDLRTREGQLAGVRWLSISVLVSGVIQILTLLPSLRAAGFHFGRSMRVLTPAIRKLIAMTLPVALGAAVLQVSVLLDKAVAFILSEGPGRATFELLGTTIRFPMAEGATQRLNWAQFLYQFPLGVFAGAVATAIFPVLSADAFDADRERFRTVLRRGIEASLFIGLPASVGMILVRYPAVRLLFERGNFTQADTVLVARSTALYSAGIWAFGLQQLLNRAYYALHDTRTPLLLGVLNLLINLAVEMPLLWTPLAEAGMAAGTLVAFVLQAVFMLYLLERKAGGLGLKESAPRITRMFIATALMAGACMLVRRSPLYPAGQGPFVWACQLALLMVVGGGVYFATCAALGLNVLRQIRRVGRE